MAHEMAIDVIRSSEHQLRGQATIEGEAKEPRALVSSLDQAVGQR